METRQFPKNISSTKHCLTFYKATIILNNAIAWLNKKLEILFSSFLLKKEKALTFTGVFVSLYSSELALVIPSYYIFYCLGFFMKYGVILKYVCFNMSTSNSNIKQGL